MRTKLICLVVGAVAGLAAGWLLFVPAETSAAGNDRHEDFVLCTGPVNAGQVGPDLDGLWLLDYRTGKLLGSVVSRQTGKVTAWGEADLVKEFEVAPRQKVHFLMTTGIIAQGQSALYVAETTTGKLGIYTMVVDIDGQPTVHIRRHDMVLFRAAKQPPG